MMTPEQEQDMVFQFRQAIAHKTAQHRRTHAVVPDPEEYILCWAKAVMEESPAIRQVRKPGRPRKRMDEQVFLPE